MLSCHSILNSVEFQCLVDYLAVACIEIFKNGTVTLADMQTFGYSMLFAHVVS